LKEFFANFDFHAQGVAQELTKMQRANAQKRQQQFRLALRIE
tara:strand:+ start:6869 stop:6994 length:126 start_codon:yes stop_codon:yes gene_type:complete